MSQPTAVRSLPDRPSRFSTARRRIGRRAASSEEPPSLSPTNAILSVRRAWVLGVFLCALVISGVLLIAPHAGAQDGMRIAPGAAPAAAPPTASDRSVILSSIAIVAALTVLSAVFSMAETALTSVRRSRVDQLVEEGRPGAETVQRLQSDAPRYIATVQAGITLLGFAAAASAAVAIAPEVSPLLMRLGLATRVAHNSAVAIVVILVAIVTLVFGEIAPKAIAMQSPDVWALRLAPFVNFCAVIFAPLNAIVLGLSNIVVLPFGARARFETPMITREEFEQIIESGTQKGEFDRTEQVIIENVIDFSETVVRSVMTPRIDMTSVPVNATMPETLQAVLSSGHSRLPVYETTVDNIVGIVYAKDLLQLFAEDRKPGTLDLRRVLRSPFFVPESRRVADLLAEMRRSKNQIAVVQDEYGGTAGIVSLEDLIEEIVGDIRDEYDVDEPEIQVLSATESLMDGRMNIADVNDRLGTELPDEEYTTIGGLIFGLLGHEPVVGERVQNSGIEFVVERLDGRRIKTVRAVRQTDTEESEPAAAADGAKSLSNTGRAE